MRRSLFGILVLANLAALSTASATTFVTGSSLETRLLQDFSRTGNVDQLRAQAGTAYKGHKREPVPAYLLAYAEYLSGNHAGALSLAEESARWAGPDADPRYQTTVRRLRTGEPDPFPYSTAQKKK
ncbi:MAG: hypothetical protein H6617_08175 [Bdellovibrionaceae bacterium]|nr:hypothetical protein [Pseudobdellovibrionaceae bacterium]